MFTTVGIILPSRGLIFAEVIKSIEEQRTPSILTQYFISTDKTIPDCLNTLVDEALESRFDYLLFVEEDTVPPKGSIAAMVDLARKADAPLCVCIDYPLYNGASSIWTSKKTGEIVFCGFGCTLVDTRIFEKLQKPYFRTDMELMMGEGADGNETRWQETKRAGYGRHDIYFFKTLTEAGFKICVLPGVVGKHLELKEMGNKLTNTGLHNIGLKADKITQRYTL